MTLFDTALFLCCSVDTPKQLMKALGEKEKEEILYILQDVDLKAVARWLKMHETQDRTILELKKNIVDDVDYFDHKALLSQVEKLHLSITKLYKHGMEQESRERNLKG